MQENFSKWSAVPPKPDQFSLGRHGARLFRIADLGKHRAWGIGHGKERGQRSEVGDQRTEGRRKLAAFSTRHYGVRNQSLR